MSIECKCCGRQLTRKEIIEELAEKLDWEEHTHYRINEGDYSHQPDTATLLKTGLEDILKRQRDED